MNSAASAGKPTGPAAKKRNWSGLEFYPIVVVALGLGYRLTDLFRAFVDRTFNVSLELTGNDTITTRLGDHEVFAQGVMNLRLPAEDLAGATQGLLIAADLVVVIGLLLAGWFAVRIIRLVSKGLAFERRTRRAIYGLFSSVLVAGFVAGALQLLGDNLVIRDLGLADLPVDNSIGTGVIWGWLGILGGIGTIGVLIDRGARVESELEGVI